MNKKFKIGIDYGGTKIEGILLDSSGKEINRKRLNYNKDYQSSIQTILKIVKDFKVLTSSDYTIGIGIPGFSSKETGLINNSNALWLNNKPFKKDLEKLLKKELKIMNDANCFTLSESMDGAGQNYKSVFGIIIGTGFGGGLSFNKEIIEGVNQVAGDWGHQPLPYANKEEVETNIKCSVPNCGRKLCSEQFISGAGFEKNFNKKYRTQYSAAEIAELSLKGDQKANDELSLYEDRLSRIISVMIGIFDPEAIILGGGMSNIDRFYNNIPKIIPKYTFSDKVRNKILKNIHGDSSGVRGAAWLWDK
jgi:fructokinase